MSEYWVSKKKYFCKRYPFSQQHENGLRHKGNQERFIRSIYKAGEKKKKDDEEERREMARCTNRFCTRCCAGHAKLSSSGPTPSTSAAPRKPAPKPSNPFANYSTAKSLGYDDPDAERLAAEAEQRRSQGVAGEWEMVAPSDLAPPPSSSDVGVKRSAEALEEEESREFKLRKKTMATGLGQIYDPGILPIKLKKKEEPVEPAPVITAPSLSTDDTTDKPKWGKLQWKKMGDPTEPIQTSEADVKPEPAVVDIFSEREEEPARDLDQPPTIKSEPDSAIPTEPVPSTIVFKKRKAPAGGTRGRRPGA
ncbi:hypothetical protein K438DRAFT_1903794 [Mycena galopus ATCC 62051]|nr:hypothetical protein K438DRAFT_1903794 [Mycena galopus ATCC 62051]